MIDITTSRTAILQTGDDLAFTISSYGFATNATRLGLDPTPGSISFSLIAGLDALGGEFEVSLTSRDGSVTTSFPGVLTFAPAQFQGTYYQGQVAALYGSITLPPSVSQALFAGNSALLQLRNVGSQVSLGLPPYTLSQDLSVSLSAAGFSSGAVSVQVQLNDATPAQNAPEPHSAVLITLGAGLFALIARRVNRFSHRKI